MPPIRRQRGLTLRLSWHLLAVVKSSVTGTGAASEGCAVCGGGASPHKETNLQSSTTATAFNMNTGSNSINSAIGVRSGISRCHAVSGRYDFSYHRALSPLMASPEGTAITQPNAKLPSQEVSAPTAADIVAATEPAPAPASTTETTAAAAAAAGAVTTAVGAPAFDAALNMNTNSNTNTPVCSPASPPRKGFQSSPVLGTVQNVDTAGATNMVQPATATASNAGGRATGMTPPPSLPTSPITPRSQYKSTRSEAAASSNDKPLSGVSALVVDDALSILKVVSTAIKSKGATVTMAMDGLEAVKKFELGSYDLVVTDIQMPVLGVSVLTHDDNRDDAHHRLSSSLDAAFLNERRALERMSKFLL
jgi:Response regulator receiver domain